MQDLDYIDSYFKGILPQAETARFEQRITGEAPFAEQVAFYCLTMQAAKEQIAPAKKERFRELYRQHDPALYQPRPALVRKLMPYAAAAAVLAALVLGWFLLMKPASPQQMANAYTQKEFAQLGIKMDSRQDSLQTGLRWYNEGKLNEALAQFESMLARDSNNTDIKTDAGIVSLRLGNYDKALNYFGALERYPGLHINPGKFYYALTLMKRSMPGDQQKAKTLLQQVVQENLGGKETAQQWLSNW
jgi:tetratricopeptide (TPR) repeat protein